MPPGSEPSSGPATWNLSELTFARAPAPGRGTGTVEKVGPRSLPPGGGRAERVRDASPWSRSAVPGAIVCLLSALAPPRDRHPGAARGLARPRPQGPQAAPTSRRACASSASPGAMLTYGIEDAPDARRSGAASPRPPAPSSTASATATSSASTSPSRRYATPVRSRERPRWTRSCARPRSAASAP